MSKVVVMGLGYVGLPLAVRAAEVGHSVIGFDLDDAKVAAVNAGATYIEDVTDEQLQRMRAKNRLVAKSAFDADDTFDIGIIAVPTPMRGDEPDLSYVESAARLLGVITQPGASVVLESTTYPGTTETLLRVAVEETSGLVAGVDFHLGFSPERIDPGHKVYNLQNTPKLVSATTEEGLNAIRSFYDTIVDTTVPVSSPRVAEMTKLFENIQANVLIALINEVAELCHELDIDVWEMVEASMTKGHSMSYWTPGPGVGGHCLPVDPMYLAWLARTRLDRPFEFAELADKINKHRPEYVAQRAAELIDLDGTDVLVLGVAYKPNVGDLRESPAIDVVKALQARGAHVTVSDPHVTSWTATPVLPDAEVNTEVSRFPLTLVVTNHGEFDYEKIAEQAQLVLDCRNAMPKTENVVSL